MPEGHTIHRLARDLNTTLRGAPVAATSPQGRFADSAALLCDGGLRRAHAWGKYLFADWSNGQVLHIHLGLIGKFRRVDPETPERDSIRLRLTSGDVMWDLTGPTRCELITPSEQRAITSSLGADPLRPTHDLVAARSRFASSAKPVGALLLDQSVIAGIGNVYRAEILFLCGVDPMRPARDLSSDEFERIWGETVRLLRIGRRLGRIVTTDPDEIGRPRSRMRDEDRLYVYHREHCRRCGTALITVSLAGRPMQHCPTCQPG